MDRPIPTRKEKNVDIKITINTDNAAFEGQTRAETARILRKLADTLDYSGRLDDDTKLPLFDANGNKVGFLTVKE